MSTISFHQYLRAWRLSKKLSLERVGAAIGVRHTTVGRWEKGQLPVTSADLEQLARVYGVPADRLLFDPADQSAAALATAREVISRMEPEDVTEWLRLGDRLTR